MAASRRSAGSSLSPRFRDAGFGPPPTLPVAYASTVSAELSRSAARAGGERDALSALAFSTSTRPSEAASALAYFDTLQRQCDEAQRRVAALEAATEEACWWLAGEAARAGAASPFFSVTFAAGRVGMLLAPTPAGRVAVVELRAGEDGKPLLAQASGAIAIGDIVVAINGKMLGRHGPPSAEDVAAELRAASRPMTVLFRRHAEARLLAAVMDGRPA